MLGVEITARTSLSQGLSLFQGLSLVSHAICWLQTIKRFSAPCSHFGDRPCGDSSRKRINVTDEGTAVLSLRMFRIIFTVNAAAREVTLAELKSGYSAAELADSADPYADKAVHRLFSSWSAAV